MMSYINIYTPEQCLFISMFLHCIIGCSLRVRLHAFLPPPPTATMATLKLMTWNAWGLCARAKRTAILTHLRSLRADISVFVEIHVTSQMQVVLKKSWVVLLYQTPFTSNCGVAILIAKSVQFQIHTVQSDHQDQLIF